MGGSLSSNNLKSKQDALYENAKYVVDKHLNTYLSIKGQFQGLECVGNKNGSKFITNLLSKIILNNLTIIKASIDKIGSDKELIEEEIIKFNLYIDLILKIYNVCIAKKETSKLDERKFIRIKIKYSSLVIDYENLLELSDSDYNFSIYNMLDYINDKVKKLIKDVNKDKEHYNNINKSWTSWLPYKIYRFCCFDFQSLNKKEAGHTVFIDNILLPLQSDITNMMSSLYKGTKLISMLKTVFDNSNDKNIIKQKENAMRIIGTISNTLSFV